MRSDYEINNYTLAILPIDSKTSKVIEREESFLIQKSATEIVDDSCRYFGSSYEGRHKGTKRLLGFNYKAPIIIEETSNLIFFPTSSPRYNDCIWISLKNIDTYKRINQNSLIIFKNGYQMELPISIGILENQIFRATRLECVLRERKELCLN